MSYVASGKSDGAVLCTGGERHGTEGYFIKPTIFTDTKPDMRIVKEEIFGPVGVVIRFEDEEGEFPCPCRCKSCGVNRFFCARRAETGERHDVRPSCGCFHQGHQ